MKIPYGIKDFKKIITENYYYVDKTMYINQLEETGSYLVYLRPRRFGKSLFLSMLEYYYDINSKNEYEALFKDTYIYKTEAKKRNSYYILNFDFSGIETINIDMIKNDFRRIVAISLENFIIKYNLDITIDYNDKAANMVRSFLSKFNTLNLDKKIYVLIDEYDEFTNAILKGDAKDFSDLLTTDGYVRCFYAVLKTYSGTVIDRMFITGVCSVSLDSMTSGFNIAKNITTNEIFNSMIGFTHKEVKTMLESFGAKEEMFNLMRENYNGYLFNEDAGEKIFASTLVMYFLDFYTSLNKYPKDLIDANIIPNYEKIMGIISLGDNKHYYPVLKDLYDDRNIVGELKTNLKIITKDLNNNMQVNISRDDIISLLFYFGYITISSIVDEDNMQDNRLVFTTPNKVIDNVYNELYLLIFKDYNFVLDRDILNEKFKILSSEGDIRPFSLYIEEKLKEMNPDFFIHFKENSIQSIYYILINTYTSNFIPKLELSLGSGKCDLFLFKSGISKYNIMIEFKYLTKKDRNIKEKINEAKMQINSYASDKLVISDTKKYIIVYKMNRLECIEEVG